MLSSDNMQFYPILLLILPNNPYLCKIYQLIQIAVKNNPKVCIEAPLNYMDKQNIIKTALKYGVPLEHTWTCVSNGDKPCGICQPCRNRKEAFESIGLKDPAYLV